MKYYKLLASIILATTVACNKTAPKESHGIEVVHMDTTIKPGDDFFNYVNGNWMKNAVIPDDRTRWGSFDELRQNTDLDALNILKNAGKNSELPKNSDERKAVNIYETYLNFEKRNELGIKPILPLIEKINQLKNIKETISLISEKLPEGSLGFFSFYISADAKDSNKNTIYIRPGSIGLPDRDYYVSNDADPKEKRDLYQKHIVKMLQYLNINETDAKKQAASILKLETKMAEARLDRVEIRDKTKTYNPMSIVELQTLTPSINWSKIIEQVGLKNVKEVVVSMPKYMIRLEELLQNTPIETIKSYLRWTHLNKNSSKLSQDIDAASFAFYGKIMTGAVAQRPEEERALQIVNRSVGEALGKLYVKEKFPTEAKVKAKEMVDYVIKSYKKRISNLPWMNEETKKGAYEKLEKFTVKIGYPDQWKDYSKLVIKSVKDGGSYFENMKNVSIWSFHQNIADYEKPVNKTKWGMSPQTVNAYFNPAYNEIVFPAAILQPPFYDYKADMAVNFGGIGAVIGHEISHGFDDSGAKYNADGNLVDWWSKEDLKKFTALGTALADQYSNLEPLPNIFVDGKFTLGENIGDLGGVNSAYDALQMYLTDKGRPKLIDGFTPEQRFFISWGTIWRTKMRDEAVKNQVKTDPHSPGMYRAYVPLQNVDAWYEAFDIKSTDKLYLPEQQRVKIW